MGDYLKAKKIGFFGGTFDPIHLGHINLAIQIFEKHGLDQILFCPASQSPHKTEMPPIASKDERRAMITAALAPLPKFTMIDMEMHQGGPSFTIDTIRTLLQEGEAEKKQYFLILGGDSLRDFHTWKEVEELVVLAPPLVGIRAGNEGSTKAMPKSVSAAIDKGLTETSIMEISSTEIRRRIGLGLYCGHLLPAKVWEYINTNELYKTHEK